ncbi:MAG: hypothetical protein JXA10_17450 [Anaerolineae bacterium]|nr:hypothetical protein [Anaerolineae bacterium]
MSAKSSKPSSKRDTHRAALQPLLLAALDSPGLLSPNEFMMARYSLNPRHLRVHLLDPDIAALEDYVIDHSQLPGRRANLEMATAFADEVNAFCNSPSNSLRRSYVAMEWLLWVLMNRHPPEQFGSDPDSPLQMPQFCGAVAFGEWAAAFQQIEAGVMMMFTLAKSPLWRIREAVAMGLQRMLARKWDPTIHRLRRAALDIGPEEWRALVAGIAEPDLLTEQDHALAALDLHYAALSYLRRLPEKSRKTDRVRTLRQALGYTVSVTVAAAPEAGFPLMRAWLAWDDPDVRWVIRENLKKKRLSPWADEVANLSRM